jgi:hypothetical protein
MDLAAINKLCLKICIFSTFTGAMLMILLIWSSSSVAGQNDFLLKAVISDVTLFIAAFATLVSSKVFTMFTRNNTGT